MTTNAQATLSSYATSSHTAMLRGAISLAWVDGTLHEEEKKRLHHFITHNITIHETQKAQLHAAIDTEEMLEDVWQEITEVQDKAHLINIATLIFWEDDTFCEAEKKMFRAMQSWHNDVLPEYETNAELAAMATIARKQWREEEDALRSELSFTERMLDYLSSIF
jgi:hypothetical protein